MTRVVTEDDEIPIYVEEESIDFDDDCGAAIDDLFDDVDTVRRCRKHPDDERDTIRLPPAALVALLKTANERD
jgi:hypothetical protein